MAAAEANFIVGYVFDDNIRCSCSTKMKIMRDFQAEMSSDLRKG